MNRLMDPTLWTLVTQQTMQVTVVALVVFLLVKLFARDRPHLAHSLWALVLLKCITPPVIALPTSPFSWLGQDTIVANGTDMKVATPRFANRDATHREGRSNTNETFESRSSASVVVELGGGISRPLEPVNEDPNAKARVSLGWVESWRGGLLVSWLVGSVVRLLCVAFRLRRFLAQVRRSSLHSEEASVKQLECQMRSIAKRVGLRDSYAARVRVRVVDANIGPAVVGLLRPTVLLPKVIVDESSSEELELLLAHELIHVRRGDLVWATLQTLATSLWWFHPLVFRCARWFDREAERSCDEETITSLACQPVTYARSLLSVLERKHQLQIAPALPGVRPVDITRERMDRIMRIGNGSHARSPWWCSGVLLLGAAVTLPGAAWVVAQDNVVESKPLAELRLPELKPDVPSDAVIERQYDLSETLGKTQQGKSREEALLEIKQFVRSAAERSHVASSTARTPGLGIQSDFAVLLSDDSVEINAEGRLIARGGSELHESVRNELDRLKQFGTDKLSIETRFISIPAESLKELEVDWELLRDNSVVTSVTSDNSSDGRDFVIAASADDVSNYQFPVLTAQLSPQTLEALLFSIQRNLKSNVMMCPRVTMFNGMEVSIRDSITRPFVVGMQEVHSGDKEVQQPVVRLIPSGTSLHLLPEFQDDTLTLRCTVNLSQIEELGTFSYRRTGQAAGEGITLQVPRVAATSIRCQAENMSGNGSFVIATPRPGMMSEVVIVVVTPRKIESTSDVTSAIENAFKNVESPATAREKSYGETSRVPIIGPTTKGQSISTDPPSDDEIIHALQKIPSGQVLVKQVQDDPKQKFEIVKEKIADYLDPPRFVPLLGDAQLHHSHYKCTVHVELASGTSHQRQIEPRIVYVDHQHFHLVTGD